MNDMTFKNQQEYIDARKKSGKHMQRGMMEHVINGTTSRDKGPMKNAPGVYTDPARFEAEKRELFMKLPLFVGLTPDMPNPGDKILFDMATGTKVEQQTLIYRGRKNFKAENGVKYRCLVFSLVEYKKGKEKEVITFYVTDDKNHLPVRLDLYLNFGSAKAFLREIKGNRHPLTSIIEK